MISNLLEKDETGAGWRDMIIDSQVVVGLDLSVPVPFWFGLIGPFYRECRNTLQVFDCSSPARPIKTRGLVPAGCAS